MINKNFKPIQVTIKIFEMNELLFNTLDVVRKIANTSSE
jgi:hypothetical protein